MQMATQIRLIQNNDSILLSKIQTIINNTIPLWKSQMIIALGLANSVNALKGSALGKAVIYAQNQKPYMENYLLDGRCSLSNNVAENAIRPFTVGRKNWLFADTPKGASASAAVYSLIETAKANGLNVYAYLQHLLLYMPSTEWQRHPEELDDLMPWSPDVQEQCK